MDNSPQLVQIIREWVDVITHRSISGWARYVKTSGLSMPQFSILMHLHYKGQCGISDISERMDVTSAAGSQLVERLFQAGLVERAEDPHDRRAKHITLSPKGQALLSEGMEQRFGWVEPVVASLTPEQREKAGEGLLALTEAIRQMDEPVFQHRV
jgi:DNA-binding MarR family transcriptional regulator